MYSKKVEVAAEEKPQEGPTLDATFRMPPTGFYLALVQGQTGDWWVDERALSRSTFDHMVADLKDGWWDREKVVFLHVCPYEAARDVTGEIEGAAKGTIQ